MGVARILEALASILSGTEYKDGFFFNPVQDGNGDWIISLQEATFLSEEDYEIIDYVEQTN